MVGKTLGHYEIIEPLGAGGMGEVYRARDMSLKRDVAIKVLPEDLGGDAERVARLEREAHLLAALNHPNIATIHSLEEAEGTRFLVMELVKGAPLDQRLARGPLSMDEALDFCRQIAKALEAAHAEGIIHRDLKPANVIVTPDGQAKVLDFGIAKSIATRATPGETEMDTNLTADGALIGTPAFMSPEQVRGLPIDERADIWAFGCLLFTALTGRGAFERDTLADTLAAIVEHEPDWDQLPDTTPPAIDALLHRCLRKDPEHRLHHIVEARIELEEALRQTVGDATGTMGRATSATGPASGRPLWISAAAGVAIVAIVVLGWMYYGTIGESAGGGGAPLVVSVDPLVAGIGVAEQFPAISPDGNELVFTMPVEQAAGAAGAAPRDLFTRRVEGRNATNLTNTPDADERHSTYSPDGARIAYTRVDAGAADGNRVGGIWVMGSGGEDPRRLTDFGFDPSWSRDGERVYFGSFALPGTSPYDLAGGSSPTPSLWEVTVDNGELRAVFEPPDGWTILGPEVSPDGRRVAFWGVADGSGQRDIWTMSVDGGVPVAVTDDVYTDFSPVWAPDGAYLYFGSDRGRSTNVWRIAIDETTGEPIGGPEALTSGGFGLPGNLSISRDGTRLVYDELASRSYLVRADFDAESLTVSSITTRISDGPINVSNVRVSPDGQWVAYNSSNEKNRDIWVADREGTERQLTDDWYREYRPRWQGSNTIFFNSDRGGSYDVWAIDIDGGTPRQVTATDFAMVNARISPDGRYVTFFQVNSPEWFLGEITADPRAFEARALPRLPDGSPFGISDWSPDSKLLLGSAQGGNNETFIYSLETEQYRPLSLYGDDYVFLADGSLVSYRTSSGARREYFVFDVASGQSRPMTIPELRVESLQISRDLREAFFRTGPPREFDISLLEFGR